MSNKCLCCGKEINVNDLNYNKCWHDKCVEKFFGVKQFPVIEYNDDKIKDIINKNMKGVTVPGVQKKLSLHLFSNNGKDARLTLTNYPSGYILKPQALEYNQLPELEYLAMQLAKEANIACVPYALVKLDNNDLAYITKRIDRCEVNGKIIKYAMEDFCQLDNRLTEDKYKGSYERCAKIIDNKSKMYVYDKTELFYRIVFSYVIGNSDMHLKNLSLINDNGKYHLSKAYDFLPIKLVMPNDLDELALTIDGKNRNLTRNSFVKYGKSIGLVDKTINKTIEDLCLKKELFIKTINESYINEEYKKQLIEYIIDKISKLTNE